MSNALALPERQGLGALPADSVPNAKGALRILHVLDRMAMGGTEQVVLSIIRGLEPANFEHWICTVRGVVASECSLPDTVPTLQVGAKDAAFQFLVPPLVRVMRNVRPAIVHSRNWGAIEAVLAARIAGVPAVIHSEHGYDASTVRGLPLRQRLMRRLAYGMADCVFTVSKELRQFHAQQAWMRRDSIDVLYNGVDTHQFRAEPQLRESCRRQLGIPEDAKVVGSVGRMVAIKDYPTLLNAASVLSDEIPDLRVLLVGSGPELPRLQKQVIENDKLRTRVVFAGTSDRVPEMLNAMDVFVSSSVREGMSNTVLQALAVGMPVVATSVGGNTEIIEDSCGYLFTPGDVAGLSKRLRLLLENRQLRTEMGSAGRSRAVERFSIATMLQGYGALYTRLAKAAGTGAGEYVRN